MESRIESQRASSKKYYWLNRDKELARQKLWRDSNREQLREIYKVSARKRRAVNPEITKRVQREYTKRIRQEALLAYGGCCACCGESTYEFLSIDHMAGGGTAERKVTKRAGWKMCLWLRQQGFPSGYRVLCHNCNQAIGFYKVCPHTYDTAASSDKGIQ